MLTQPEMLRHIDARFGVNEQFSERMTDEILAFLQRRVDAAQHRP
jgi:hypothetical protein